jgi:hypothetical protein
LMNCPLPMTIASVNGMSMSYGLGQTDRRPISFAKPLSLSSASSHLGN